MPCDFCMNMVSALVRADGFFTIRSCEVVDGMSWRNICQTGTPQRCRGWDRGGVMRFLERVGTHGNTNEVACMPICLFKLMCVCVCACV